jgi:hypothetical protein
MEKFLAKRKLNEPKGASLGFCGYAYHSIAQPHASALGSVFETESKKDTINPTAVVPRRKMGDDETPGKPVANNDNHSHLCDSRVSKTHSRWDYRVAQTTCCLGAIGTRGFTERFPLVNRIPLLYRSE